MIRREFATPMNAKMIFTYKSEVVSFDGKAGEIVYELFLVPRAPPGPAGKYDWTLDWTVD